MVGWSLTLVLILCGAVAGSYIQNRQRGSAVARREDTAKDRPITEQRVMRAGDLKLSTECRGPIDPSGFAELVDRRLFRRSGSVFYSGTAAFSGPSPVYILGLNPGGSPSRQADETIGRDLEDWLRGPPLWSAYVDESWEGKAAGTHGMQPRMLHLFRRLGLDPRRVPASNVVFVRSSTEATLIDQKTELLRLCWPVHEAVIDRLEVRSVICLGGTAGSWVRSMLGANFQTASWRETNSRGWQSAAHTNGRGLHVLTLTHPGRADWRNPAADPTELVRKFL
jgi:hypothetical protein